MAADKCRREREPEAHDHRRRRPAAQRRSARAGLPGTVLSSRSETSCSPAGGGPL